MSLSHFKKALLVISILLLSALLFIRLLPLFFPFLIGLAAALAAEPAAAYLQRRLGFRPGFSCAAAVTAILLLFAAALILLLTMLTRQLTRLSDFLPQLAAAFRDGAQLLEQWLQQLTDKAPSDIRSILQSIVNRIFSNQSLLSQQALGKIPQAITDFLSHLSNGLLGLVAAVLSSYMLCPRLPALRRWIAQRFPQSWKARYAPAIKDCRKALLGWLLAEGKLAALAFFLLTIGFFLLRLPNALLLAGLITLVDILPILGVGTVLIPWSVISFLQNNNARALGLLGIFLVIWLARSVLEPKLLGKELGLDPLLTLIAVYAGFRVAGILGMILAPVLAVSMQQLYRRLSH